MKTVHYSATRLTFKRDVIEPLANDDVIIIDTREGAFKMTKADIYRDFANVIQSASYQEKGNYNYQKLPEKAYRFRMRESTTNFQGSQSYSHAVSSAVSASGDLVGDEIRNKIREIGKLWRHSEHNKAVSKEILSRWDTLIEDWLADTTLPLVVRKDTSKKGQSFVHPSGREIIIADNSLATWAYYNALQGTVFSLSQIRQLFEQDKIPVMFIATKTLKEKAKYKKALGNVLQGWKVCHIQAVGFNNKRGIDELSIEEIKAHFKKYACPSNMFVLPKEIGDLGELKEFIDEQVR